MDGVQDSTVAAEGARMTRVAKFDAGRHTVVKARDFVRRLAELTRAFAVLDGADAGETWSLADALAVLAVEADRATGAFDAALEVAGAHTSTQTDVVAALSSAQLWAAAAGQAMDGAVAVYANVCRVAADRIAVAEEHAPRSTPDRPLRTAAAMVAAARALTPHALDAPAG